MSITPLILGSGRAGQAVAKSLAILNLARPELEIAPATWLPRGEPLEEAVSRVSQPLVCICNPHGLHARNILESAQARAFAILSEKPACVSLEEIGRLREVACPTGVLHVYRMMWGPQALRRMVEAGEFGEIVSIEGRYWQSSSAERAVKRKAGAVAPTWKDDPALAGPYDVYLDVGTHWVDAASFLFGTPPSRATGWKHQAGSGSELRDSHVQLTLEFPNGRAFASISKAVHGAGNHFELNVVGARKSATWKFLEPDVIEIGEGRDRHLFSRKDGSLGSRQPPHHGLGWLEGYVEIASRLIDEALDRPSGNYPRLQENLDVLEAMLSIEWA